MPPDFLAQVVQPLRDPQAGLVNCFYALANPTTLAMQWEAVAVNADFWSQVLQSRTLRPLDFALGAVMATRRQQLNEIGGFRALVDYLADDYQLGNQIAKRGYRIELCPVVVECREREQGWREVWAHQLRWARTIRVCQPVPYFFSILSNATVWPMLLLTVSWHQFSGNWVWHAFGGEDETAMVAMIRFLALGLPVSLLAFAARIGAATDCMTWLRAGRPRKPGIISAVMADTGSSLRAFLAPLKDLLQVPIWALAFLGNTVVWRGQRLRVLPGGKLVPIAPKQP